MSVDEKATAPEDSTEEASTEKSPKTKQKHTRLSAESWAECVAHYELDDMTLVEMSRRHGMSEMGLRKKFKANGIKRGSRREKVVEATRRRYEQNIENTLDEKTKKVERRKGEFSDWFYMLSKMNVQMVGESVKNKKLVATKFGEFKTIKLALENLKLGYDALNLIDDMSAAEQEQIMELPLKVLSNEQIEELAKANYIPDDTDSGLDAIEDYDGSMPDGYAPVDDEDDDD